MPRKKKPAVRPEVSRQWLKRFEEDGESPPQIAKADGYDVRTVRKQIELAGQEREVREARVVVLRNALEQHYRDLVSFAQKLDTEVVRFSLSMDAKSNRMWGALHEHLPRSPLWKAIDRMERLSEEARAIEKHAEERLLEEVRRNSPVGLAAKASEVGVHPAGLVGVMKDYLGAQQNLHLVELRTSATKEGLIEITCGDWMCAIVSSEQEQDTRKFIEGLKETIESWPEREELKSRLADRSRVIDTIREELATIILKKVLPGRCKYCPI